MILGHYRLAGHCVWLIGAAHATPGGRLRLPDLKARRSDVERTARAPDPVVDFLANLKNHRLEVGQAETTASRGRVSGA